MENKKVMVKSEVMGRIGINLPDLKLRRTWERKGVIRPIPFEELEQAMYDPGVEYMFKEGMLSIDDMEVKKALGLEPEDAEVPTNIIILSDEQRKRYLTVLPMPEFRAEVNKLSYEQLNSLVDYAIENELANLDKCEFLKEKTQIDIIKAIQLKRDAKEE